MSFRAKRGISPRPSSFVFRPARSGDQGPRTKDIPRRLLPGWQQPRSNSFNFALRPQLAPECLISARPVAGLLARPVPIPAGLSFRRSAEESRPPVIPRSDPSVIPSESDDEESRPCAPRPSPLAPPLPTLEPFNPSSLPRSLWQSPPRSTPETPLPSASSPPPGSI